MIIRRERSLWWSIGRISVGSVLKQFCRVQSINTGMIAKCCAQSFTQQHGWLTGRAGTMINEMFHKMTVSELNFPPSRGKYRCVNMHFELFYFNQYPQGLLSCRDRRRRNFNPDQVEPKGAGGKIWRREGNNERGEISIILFANIGSNIFENFLKVPELLWQQNWTKSIFFEGFSSWCGIPKVKMKWLWLQ